MKQYYYLDAARTPKGPHSLEELSAMLTSRKVLPTTLVACMGGSSWETLGYVLNREMAAQQLPTLPEPPPVGCCPDCGHDFSNDVVDYQLPAQCPGCGRWMRAEEPTIKANIRLALRNYAKFSGRAARAEYWSFFLFSTVGFVLIALLMGVAIGVVKLLGLEAEADAFWQKIIIGLGSGTLALWFCYTIVPGFSSWVRRLHDVGWSGWWIFWNFFSVFLMIVPFLGIFGLSLLEPSKDALAIITVVFLLICLIGSMAGQALNLLLFILCLLDSQHGANKYGPSNKYPVWYKLQP